MSRVAAKIISFAAIALAGVGGVALVRSLSGDAAIWVVPVQVWLLWLAALIAGRMISAPIGWGLWGVSGALGAATVTAALADSVGPWTLAGLIAATMMAVFLSSIGINRAIDSVVHSKQAN
jgi:hypothetical protein